MQQIYLFIYWGPLFGPGKPREPMSLDLWSEQSYIDSQMWCTCGLSGKFFIGPEKQYCKSTKFGVLSNLADLALGQKLNRII